MWYNFLWIPTILLSGFWIVSVVVLRPFSLSPSHCEVTMRRSAQPASRLCAMTASCVATMAWMITATATAFTPRWPWTSLWPVSAAESETGWRSRGMTARPLNLPLPTTACPTLLLSSTSGAARIRRRLHPGLTTRIWTTDQTINITRSAMSTCTLTQMPSKKKQQIQCWDWL